MAESSRPSQPSRAATTCPLCGGTVPPGAGKCLFCASVVVRTSEAGGAAGGRSRSDLLGGALLCLPAMIVVFTVSYVVRLSPLQSPVTKLLAGGFLAALVSAILAALEASRAPAGDSDVFTPRQWFLVTLFAWPVGYPLYLRERSRRGVTDLMIPGAVISVLFTLIFLSFAASTKIRAASAERAAVAARGKSGVRHYDPQVASALWTSATLERKEIEKPTGQ